MRVVFLGAWVCLAVCGCMSTRHVESSRVVTAGLDTSGPYTTPCQFNQDARSWHGPWVCQPERARP
jgi:hypothetical protein